MSDAVLEAGVTAFVSEGFKEKPLPLYGCPWVWKEVHSVV